MKKSIFLSVLALAAVVSCQKSEIVDTKYLNMGVKNLTMVDRFGIIARDMEGLNEGHRDIAALTNPECKHGTLADAMVGADVFVGVSAPLRELYTVF